QVRSAARSPLSALFEDLPALDELERRYLLYVLEVAGGNRTRAAEILGIDRRTLYRMIERHNVDANNGEESHLVYERRRRAQSPASVRAPKARPESQLVYERRRRAQSPS